MNKRVVIIVKGGMADYVNDADVDVCLIDVDNIEAGYTITSKDIEGFEDIVPQWIKDDYLEDEADPSETHCDTCGYIHEVCDCKTNSMRKITFNELTDILDNAEAVRFDGTLTYPVVEDDCFGFDLDYTGDLTEYRETDIDNIVIVNGMIEITVRMTDVYVIQVLEHKELV